MKKTNHYNFSFLSRRALTFLLAGTLIFLPGCQSQYKNKYVAENTLPGEEDLKSSFKDTYYPVNQDGNRVVYYYSKDIRLFYDPETGVQRVYLIHDVGGDFYLYTFPDGNLEMIYLLSDFACHYFDPEHYEYIKENSIQLLDPELSHYIGDITIKDSYTEDEIKDLLQLYVDGVDVIEEKETKKYHF